MYPKKDFKQFKPDLIRQGLAPNATYLDWLKFERQFSEPEQHKVLDYKIKNPRGNI